MNEPVKGEYWLKCWIAVASSDNCVASSTCTKYADVMIEQYEKRFKTDPESHKKDSKESIGEL